MDATLAPVGHGGRTERHRAAVAPFLSFFTGAYASLEKDPEAANFAVGNPHEFAMPSYVATLRDYVEPRDKDWYAYKLSEPEATSTVARSMSSVTGLDWDPLDVQMTNGGFAALAIAFRTLLEEGDEAVYLSPPWFFYELLIVGAGGVPVGVDLEMPYCPIDTAAIDAAITPRTRLVVINSPHNPSGRVLEPAELQVIADTLTAASRRIGHDIYIVSDEPYRRILFDGRTYHSPSEFYPHTIVTYSYGKQLLAPGMRIGYVTWPPTLSESERLHLRDDVFINQLSTGFSFPNADLQHALPDLEPQCVDMAAMQRRRDRMVGALRGYGYEATSPQGTFYIMARSPIADDEAFCALLNQHKVLVLPGAVVNTPGWFRISLTASDEMVDRGLPGFESAMREAKAGGAQ